MIRNTLLLFLGSLFIASFSLVAQDKVYETFMTTRLINAHTIETVDKGKLDVRITHRFDDIAGDLGGFETFFGLDNVTDIRIAFEYGVTNDLTVGFGRSKGVLGPLKLLDGFVKYRWLKQTTDNKMPISLTVFGNTVTSIMKATDNPASETAFDKFAHRLSYDVQVIIARKFSDRLSLQIMPNYLHRNFVQFGDENDIFSIGIGGRIAIAKHYAIIFDYYQFFSEFRQYDENKVVNFFPPLGIGLEIKTGGHVFHVNFSNSPAILENQFIPSTTKSWLDGQFRLGFNISRPIQL